MDQVLERLLDGEVISGEQLSRELNVTRSAVWKQIEQLRNLGFVIEARGRQGYQLVFCPDSLMASVVRKGLDTVWAGRNIISLRSVDSTNRYCKALAAEGGEHGIVVLAETQTGGRGRRGRGWMTPEGEAVAMSVLLRPQLHPSQVSILSLAASVAAARAIGKAAGVETGIKWPNDIVVNGKKVCGILLEMDANEQQVNYVVAGFGINVHQKSFPDEIVHTATSLDLTSGKQICRAELVREMLRQAEAAEQMIRDGSLLQVYHDLSVTLGKMVTVSAPSETYSGCAKEITESGTLLVETEDGQVREVYAGDVSVRGLMGYV